MQFERIARPVPGAGEVLIKVEAAGVDRVRRKDPPFGRGGYSRCIMTAPVSW
jgi:hypothetical protein